MFKLRLKELREQNKLSQRELADILDVSQGSIGNWESGTREPDLEMIKRIASYFKVSLDYLLGESDNPEPPELVIPDALKGVKVAFHRGEFEDLTQYEVDRLAEFAEFLRSKRKDEENNDEEENN